MKAAKIISFIAFISNSYLSVQSFIYFLKLQPTFQALQIQTPFPWPFVFALISAIVSIIYWFYLRKKERKGESVKFALLVSIILLIIPFLVIVPISGFIYSNPIYDYLGEINP